MATFLRDFFKKCAFFNKEGRISARAKFFPFSLAPCTASAPYPCQPFSLTLTRVNISHSPLQVQLTGVNTTHRGEYIAFAFANISNLLCLQSKYIDAKQSFAYKANISTRSRASPYSFLRPLTPSSKSISRRSFAFLIGSLKSTYLGSLSGK